MAASRKHARSYVPALGFDWLTPVYDPLARVTLPIKERLIAQADIRPGMSVLDVGCGSGALALLVKQTQPSARVVGSDVDSKVLDVAQRKINDTGLDVELHCGRIEESGFAPACFDRVLTTLVLHHLSTQEKLAVLQAVHRLLRPGGELHVVDFGAPHNALMRLVSQPLRWFGGDRMAANLSGRLPALIRDAAFATVAETEHVMTPLGTLAIWSATT